MEILLGITTLVNLIFSIYVIKKINIINKKLDDVDSANATKHSSQENDIKTLFQNQKLLLSFLDTIRHRVNNFYAKSRAISGGEPKLKEKSGG